MKTLLCVLLAIWFAALLVRGWRAYDEGVHRHVDMKNPMCRE